MKKINKLIRKWGYFQPVSAPEFDRRKEFKSELNQVIVEYVINHIPDDQLREELLAYTQWQMKKQGIRKYGFDQYLNERKESEK